MTITPQMPSSAPQPGTQAGAPTELPNRRLTDAPTDVQMAGLISAARAAREQAYAPYSHFAVGAALLDEHGRIHAGCNVENAAYPQAQCAEASAIAHLVLAGGRRILAAVVVGVANDPVTPCGGCRQRLREFAADDAPVWAADLHGVRARFTLGALLPASFGPGHLAGQAGQAGRTDLANLTDTAAQPDTPAATPTQTGTPP